MAVTTLVGEGEIRAAVGRHLGHSDWIDISAETFVAYASATGDDHGTYLAVGLSNLFLPQIVEVSGFSLGINYGTDAVRFPNELHVGMRVRGAASLDDVVDVKGGIQTRMLIVIESADGAPICTIESISRWLM